MTAGIAANKPYLFTVSFDVDDIRKDELAEEESLAPQVPTYSLEDVNAAREEGRRKGYEAGMSEAGRGIEHSIETTMETIGAHFQKLAAEQSLANAKIERESIGAAIAVVRKLLPTMAKEHSLSEVEVLVSECIAQLLQEPRVTIYVPSELVASAEARLRAVLDTAGFAGELGVLADDRLAAGDCRVVWADGEAGRDSERVFAEIETTLDSVYSQPPEQQEDMAPSPIIESEQADAPGEDQDEGRHEDDSTTETAEDAVEQDGDPQNDESQTEIAASIDLNDQEAAQSKTQVVPQLQDPEEENNETQIADQIDVPEVDDAVSPTDSVENSAEDQVTDVTDDGERPNN